MKFKLIESGEDIDSARTFVAVLHRRRAILTLSKKRMLSSRCLENYEALGFFEVSSYNQNGEEPVAFTAATQLDQLTMDVHFERALPGVEGAYTMINREFVRGNLEKPADVEFINREKRTWGEGLEAKESYHPDVLLMKYGL